MSWFFLKSTGFFAPWHSVPGRTDGKISTESKSCVLTGRLSGQFGARQAFTRAFVMRASAAAGFLVPSLQQWYYSSTVLNFVNGVPYTIRTFPLNDPAAIALCERPRKAEKSHSDTAGLRFTPRDGRYASLDFHPIRIAHRITLSGNLRGSSVQSYLALAGIPFVDGGRFVKNAPDARTRGTDLVANYSLRLSGTLLSLTGGLNYNKTDILSIGPNLPQLGLAGLMLPIIECVEQGYLTTGTPRTKTFSSGNWRIGRCTLHPQVSR